MPNIHGDFIYPRPDNKINAKYKCDCGNTEFELTLGDYEISATCKKCGASNTVYSG